MRRWTRCCALASLTWVLVLSLPAARADEGSAEQSFQAGRRVYATGDYRGAALLFEQAYRSEPRGAAAYNAALAWELVHEDARAADDYENALAATDLKEALAGDARARLRRLEGMLGRIDIKAEGGAVISVAHAERVATPARVHVAPGSYVVRASWPDGRATTRDVVVTAGSATKVSLLSDVHPTPVSPSPEHPAETPAIEPPKAASHTSNAWIYAAGAVALTGLGVGAVTGAMTLAAKSTVDADCGIGGVRTACTPAGKSAADRGELTGIVSTAGFAVGATGLAVAVVLWIVKPKARSSGGRALSPIVATNGREMILGASGTLP
jgi:hypothetical protein